MVDTDGVVVEEFSLVGKVRRLDDFAGGIDPLSERGVDQTNGPVAAPDDAVPAEMFDGVFDVRTNGGSVGIGRRAISQDTGDFTSDVWEFRECGHVSAPRV